jgi:hypothetical protein
MPTLNASTHGEYDTNTTGAAIPHNSPILSPAGWVGQAIKQKAQSWKSGWVQVPDIAIGEDFFVQTEGVVNVPNTGISGAVRGAKIYITSANALTATASGNTYFGRLSDQAGQRGCGTGRCRITLDRKDTA